MNNEQLRGRKMRVHALYKGDAADMDGCGQK